jgi:MFS family permease
VTARRARFAPTLGWVLVVVAGLAVVARVAVATIVLPAAAAEPQLVDAAYAGGTGGPAVPVDGALLTTSLQLRLYTTITWAFDRHADALTSAREMSVGATVALVLGLVVFAAILRVPSGLIAVVVATLAALGPVVTLLATVGPGVAGAGWFALSMGAGAAALLRRDFRWITAGAFAMLGTAVTVPGLLIPVLFGTAVAVAAAPRPRPIWRAVIVLGCVVAALALTTLTRRMQSTPLLDVSERLLVLTAIVAIAACAATITWLRAWAAGIGLGALAAMATGGAAEFLLPALIVGALGLLAVTVDEARTAQRSHRVYAGAATAVALGGCAAGLLHQPQAGPRPDHAALADWVRTQTAPGIPLAAGPGIWADLDRDLTASGRSPGSVRRVDPSDEGDGDGLLATLGPVPQHAGMQLAEFGDGDTSLSVLATGAQAHFLASFSRVSAGTELAANDRLKTTGSVRAALREGRVDVRAMAMLAGLCLNHTITVATTANPAAEHGYALPDRVLVLSVVDGRPVTSQTTAAGVVDWMRAQQPPYAPTTIRVTKAGVVLGWRIPARIDDFPY